MRTSLRMIARETGLSVNTVGQILNRGGANLYREETCAQVREVAHRLGYRLNAATRFMQSGRFNIVALLQCGDEQQHVPEGRMIQAAAQSLEAAGRRLMIASVHRAELAPGGEKPEIIRDRMTDGFLIDYRLSLDPLRDAALDSPDRPAIWLNQCRVENAVFPDDAGAAGNLTEALLARGFGAPAYVDYSYGFAQEPRHYSEIEHRAGWAAALDRHGLPHRSIGCAQALPRPQRFAYTLGWLNAADRPRSIIVSGQSATRVILMAAMSLGLRIPTDLAVASFSDQPVTDLGVPVISWITDYDTMGREAAAMLVRRLEQGGAPQPALRYAGWLST